MNGIGILCSGQGNQHRGMFDILSGNPVASALLTSVSPWFGCYPADFMRQLTDHELFKNRQAQLLIGTLQLATWAALRDLLPPPKVFAGYSMGEVTAYGCAGALSCNETLSLIEKRAALMDSVAPQSSGLLAIRGLDRLEIESLCRACGLEIAIVNGIDHHVVGGPGPALQLCRQHPLASRAVAIRPLQVSVPSHTSLLAPAARKFADVLAASALKAPVQPVIAGTNGTLVRSRNSALEALAQQICHPVNWQACMQTIREMGCKVLLELGPGNALTKMLQDQAPGLAVRSVADFRSLQGVADWVRRQAG